MYSANCTEELWVSCRHRGASRQAIAVTGKLIEIPVSPASPENAKRVCLLRSLVLSSDALRMVAPRIAALDAAMMVKSFPVIPKSISLLYDVSNFEVVAAA
jgi:hypothetical protein